MSFHAKGQTLEGVGTDIIEIHRIKEAIERHGDRFLTKLFTEAERHYCENYANPIPHFAGRFAAKEAIVKAMGTGFHHEIQWTEIEIINNNLGRPEVKLSHRLTQLFPQIHIFLSISHCKDYATATALVTR